MLMLLLLSKEELLMMRIIHDFQSQRCLFLESHLLRLLQMICCWVSQFPGWVLRCTLIYVAHFGLEHCRQKKKIMDAKKKKLRKRKKRKRRGEGRRKRAGLYKLFLWCFLLFAEKRKERQRERSFRGRWEWDSGGYDKTQTG